jgi:predicted phosphohydrolase
MSLYAIGDLHLSLGTDKPMDVFGGAWDDYVAKIKKGFSSLGPSDTCVLCGDLTWAMTLEESLEDFRFVDSLPGKKIILKGNHDYWWSTSSKARSFFEKNGITTIEILNNNSFPVKSDDGKTVYVCGTRGWFFEEETGGGRADAAHDRKIMAREVGRLEASLSSAPESDDKASTPDSDDKASESVTKICFLHYPPVFRNYVCRELIDVMNKHEVRSCWYGHIHGIGHRYAVTGEVGGIAYHMVSADFVGFSPVKVC